MTDGAANINAKLKHVWIYEYKYKLKTEHTLTFGSLAAVDRHVAETMSAFDEPIVNGGGGMDGEDVKIWHFEDDVSVYANRRKIKY